jgi:hypothetical protein
VRAAAADNGNQPTYNPVFERLVTDPKNAEIVHLVAYSFYTSQAND